MDEQKQSLVMPIAIILAGLLVAGAVIYSNKTDSMGTEGIIEDKTKEEQVAVNTVIEELDLISTVGHVRGDDEATLTLIEFSDPECPYCARFHSTVKLLFEEYGESGLLAWRYIHLFPFDDIPDAHPNARIQAESTECAAEVGGEEMFWKFLSAVFAEEEPRNMNKIAESLNLDTDAFNSCVENKTFAEKVGKQHDLAYNTLNLRGTPHSIIVLSDGTGYRIRGAYPIESVALSIEAALAGVEAVKIQTFLDMFQEQGTTGDVINAYILKEFTPLIEAAKTSEEQE